MAADWPASCAGLVWPDARRLVGYGKDGVEVTVLAHRAGLSARLRRAASQVVGIMDAHRPAI